MMKFSCYAISMVAGLGALLLAPAAAQAADYQVYRDANCSPNAECGINFAVVPAGKTLRIDNVSCYLTSFILNSLGAAQLVLVNQNGTRDFAVTLTLHEQDSVAVGSNDYRVFVSNDTIRAVARAGQRFRAYAQVYDDNSGALDTVEQFSCGISGTLR